MLSDASVAVGGDPVEANDPINRGAGDIAFAAGVGAALHGRPHAHRGAAAQPAHHAARLGGATALALEGRTGEAKKLLEDGVALPDPDPRIALVLAQLLATASDPALRDPQRAAELAGELFRRQPTLEHGEVLAVALAGLGRFDEAGKLQQSLIDAVGPEAPPEVRARLERSLEQYRRGAAGAPPATRP